MKKVDMNNIHRTTQRHAWDSVVPVILLVMIALGAGAVAGVFAERMMQQSQVSVATTCEGPAQRT